MSVENQNILQNTLNKEAKPDIAGLEKSVLSLGNSTEAKQEDRKQVEEVVRELVSANLPISEMEAILNKLPIDKRFIVEKMILDEQRHQIVTMSQEKYKQYLQMQFPNGVPANAGEMALSMVTDTAEGYRSIGEKILQTTARENPSEIEKKELIVDQRHAVTLTQESEEQARKLAFQLSHVAEKETV